MDYIQSLSILFDGSYLFLPHLSFIKTRNGSCTTCLFYVSSSKIASFITLPFRKRMQNYCLFLNQQNFLGIIFKKMKKKAPKRLKMKWEKYVVQHKKKKKQENREDKERREYTYYIYVCAKGMKNIKKMGGGEFFFPAGEIFFPDWGEWFFREGRKIGERRGSNNLI